MRYLKYLNGRKTLINLYKSINRLLLEYGCVLFLIKTLLKKFNMMLHTGALYNTSKEKLLQELSWEMLSDRRKYNQLLLFFQNTA